LAEIFHSELRRLNYTDIFGKYFTLGNQVGERDRKAISRTVSGLIKLIHPDENCSKEEIKQYLSFAIEHRRRVKEQLKRMGGLEYAKVDLSFIDKDSGEETIVYCREPAFAGFIPEQPMMPGDVFTVGFDRDERRYALFRIQTSISPGKAGLIIIGLQSKSLKESVTMAYDLLRTTAKDIGIEQDISEYGIKIQVTSPMQGKDSDELGVAFYMSLSSAFLGRPISSKVVVLGHMNIHGELRTVEGLESKCRIAYDSGARTLHLPTNSQRLWESLPSELLESLKMVKYNNLNEAVTKTIDTRFAE